MTQSSDGTEGPAVRRRVPVAKRGAPVARPEFPRIPADDAPQSADVQSPAVSLCDCPRLEREDWHEVESDWSDITFVRSALPAAAGVPLRYNTVRAELAARAAKAGATVPEDAMMLLGEGKFRRPVMLEVEAPAGAAGLQRPGGLIYSRLVPAPMGAMRRAVDETVVQSQVRYGRSPDHVWLWYLTCRLCSGDRDYETLVVAHYSRP